MSELYKNTPNWILKIIEQKKCASCGADVKKTGICAIGIRTVKENKNKNALYVEHMCSNCSSRTISSFQEKVDTVEQLCYLLIEEIHNRKKLEKAKRTKKPNKTGVISEEEYEEVMKFLKNNDDHSEFLKYIGMNINDNK